MIIPIHVGVFMLHVFYILNVITSGRNLEFSWRFLFFVFLARIKDDTCLDSFYKLTA